MGCSTGFRYFLCGWLLQRRLKYKGLGAENLVSCLLRCVHLQRPLYDGYSRPYRSGVSLFLPYQLQSSRCYVSTHRYQLFVSVSPFFRSLSPQVACGGYASTEGVMLSASSFSCHQPSAIMSCLETANHNYTKTLGAVASFVLSTLSVAATNDPGRLYDRRTGELLSMLMPTWLRSSQEEQLSTLHAHVWPGSGMGAEGE